MTEVMVGVDVFHLICVVYMIMERMVSKFKCHYSLYYAHLAGLPPTPKNS